MEILPKQSSTDRVAKKKIMSRKLERKIKKANKIVEKYVIGGDIETWFSADHKSKTVYFESYDDITGAIVTGSYNYNKRGVPTKYGLSVGSSQGVAFTHLFELANKKSFKKLSHL